MTERQGHDHRRFTLSVLGFPTMTEEEAAAGLADAFGLPVERAQRYAREVPARVAEDLNLAQLDFHVLMLHELGAELRVVEQTGPGRWTVPARRGTPDPIDPDTLCRWRAPPPSTRRQRRERSPEEASAGDAEPASQPSVPVGVDSADDPSAVARQSGAWGTADLPSADTGDPDDAHSGDFGVAVYAPLDLESERAPWIDQLATSEFFVRGLEERRKKRGWSRIKAKITSTHKRFRPARWASREADPGKTRQRVAAITLGVCVVVGAGLALSTLLPPSARQLGHDSAVGHFTTWLPPGFDHLERNTGVYQSPVGPMGYSSYSARKRGDPVGALVFNVLDVSPATRDAWSATQILNGALRAAVSSQGGRLTSSQTIRLNDHPGLEGKYRVTRFGNTYEGRVRVYDVAGHLALLLCEGVAEACMMDRRASRFFSAFSVELAD